MILLRRSFHLLLLLLALLACGGGAALPAKGPMPPGATWTGTWNTTFGTLVMEEKDGTVIGVYKYGGVVGALKGKPDGNYLHFEWVEQEGGGGAGAGVFGMLEDGASFAGSWGHGTSADDGGAWTGTRQ